MNQDEEQVKILREMMGRPDWDKFQPWLGYAIYEYIVKGKMQQAKEGWEEMQKRKTNL
jgi:hypothetical protein